MNKDGCLERGHLRTSEGSTFVSGGGTAAPFRECGTSPEPRLGFVNSSQNSRAHSTKPSLQAPDVGPAPGSEGPDLSRDLRKLINVYTQNESRFRGNRFIKLDLLWLFVHAASLTCIYLYLCSSPPGLKSFRAFLEDHQSQEDTRLSLGPWH